MNETLVIASAILLMAEARNQDAIVQRVQNPQTRQQTNSKVETSNWRTYTNTTFGFEFRYPNHWREANTITDKANIIWINFSSAGAGKNTLYVKVFPDQKSFSVEDRLIAGNATATQVTVDKTKQNLYGDFLDIPTVMISNKNVLVEIGDPSHEGYLNQVLATFRFAK